jgi:hypothetical protein
MTINYTWKVTSLKVRDEGDHTNAVVQTHWQKIGTDDNGNEGIFSGVTPLTSVNVPDGEFIPFEELTEETVLEWIKAGVSSYEEHVNSKIVEQIQDKVNPVSESKLPWALEDPVVSDPTGTLVADTPVADTQS